MRLPTFPVVGGRSLATAVTLASSIEELRKTQVQPEFCTRRCNAVDMIRRELTRAD
jgi:hypothetical protein